MIVHTDYIIIYNISNIFYCIFILYLNIYLYTILYICIVSKYSLYFIKIYSYKI